jgi:hypothetical protein
MASASFSKPATTFCDRVASIESRYNPAFCLLANHSKVLLSRLLASQITVGDEIAFPVPAGDTAGPEICITKACSSGTNRCLYQAPVGYVTQPKLDKRQQHFVSAQVQHGNLGISAIFLPCKALREYFYRLPQADAQAKRPGLYEILGVSSRAAPAEVRLAFKLRHLELTAAGAPHPEQVAVERAFNILGQPELRACYDTLLVDPEAPAVFPYGGFGSILASGAHSRDGQTFFARRILMFLPENRRRRFHLPLRNCDFYADRALCRDARRKLEFWLDRPAYHMGRKLEPVEALAGCQAGGGRHLRPQRQIPQARRRMGVGQLGDCLAEPARSQASCGFSAAIRDHPKRLSSLRTVLTCFGSDPLNRKIKPAFAKFGIHGVGWHTFRHTVGSMLAEMGEHQLTIRDYLRHSNLSVTNKYLQATSETKRLVQDKLVGAILPTGLLSQSKTTLIQ